MFEEGSSFTNFSRFAKSFPVSEISAFAVRIKFMASTLEWLFESLSFKLEENREIKSQFWE